MLMISIIAVHDEGAAIQTCNTRYLGLDLAFCKFYTISTASSVLSVSSRISKNDWIRV